MQMRISVLLAGYRGVMGSSRYNSFVLKLCGVFPTDHICGKGQFSVIYRGADVFAGRREVAVKCIRRSESSVIGAQDTVREAVIWKMVQHPFVVCHLFDIVTPTFVYRVLEYVPGHTLFEFIRSQVDKPIEKDLVGIWIWQLGSAVEYLHGMSVCHRDLKLENILVDVGQKIVKLTDFGFAKKTIPGQEEVRCCGSIAYASPQILRGVPHNALAADVWSLGCVFYAVMNGVLPVDEEHGIDTVLECQKRLYLQWRYGCRFHRKSRSLVESMLSYDESARPTMTKVLRSSFVQCGMQLHELTSTTLAIKDRTEFVNNSSADKNVWWHSLKPSAQKQCRIL